MNYIDIYNFWFNNQKYWIPISDKDKDYIDNIIYKDYYNKKIENINDNKSFIGYIIYNDQFIKHFQRINNSITDNYILNQRQELINFIKENNILDDLLNIKDVELIFILMPFKHIFNYEFVLETIIKWCDINNKKISDTQLSKFFNDTCNKYYNNYNYKISNDISELKFSINDRISVCDYYPTNININNININKELKLLENTINKNVIVVSLSGGVDSMLSLYLLNLLKNKFNFELLACHIIYGNRIESNIEYDVVKEFCFSLDIKLHSFRIKYLKRNNVEREFYEEITRKIRFNFYKSFGDCNVYLGHIKDDVIENIWTNISKNQHIFDLKKMSINSIIEGVNIIRPFLTVDKNKILDIAHNYCIPYLKNTTPEWSNRGKFRNRFYNETIKQFGSNVDNKIIELSDTLFNVGRILDNIIFKPIINSFDNNIINITQAIKAELDYNNWLYLITEICHNKLMIKKPSTNSIKQFVDRLNKNNLKCVPFKNAVVVNQESKAFSIHTVPFLKCHLKKNLQIIIYIKNNNYFMEFIY